MRSRTEVCLRNCASAAGSRRRSSRRKYSDTNRSSPLKLATLTGPAPRPASTAPRGTGRRASLPSARSARTARSRPARLLRLPAAARPPARRAGGPRTPISCTQPLGPPAGKRQRRLFPACDRDLRAGRHVLEQLREHVQTGRIGDGVQIVEHQHQRVFECSQCAPDTWDALRPGGSAWAGQRVEHLGRERLDSVNRGRDVAQEHQGRRRLARRARPRRTDAESASAQCASRVVLPYPAGATTVAKAHARRAEPCDHVRLRHGAGPDRRLSELGLR